MWAVFLGLAMQINLPLLPHQKRFLQADTFYVGLTGGYGSGKSSSCALKGIQNTMRDPKILHAIISPSYPQAKLSIIPSIFEVLEDWMGFQEGKDFEYNKTEHFFNLARWQGQLVVLSGENPKRLKGPNLGSCGLDEPGIMEHSVLKQAVGRVRHPAAKYKQVYLCGTPEDLNWYADFIEGDLKPSSITDIRARTRDNTFLDEEFFSNLEEAYSPQELMAYMDGQFVNLNTAPAYHGFSTSNLIDLAEFGEPDPELPLLVGFDYNWSPNTAVIAQEVPDWEESPTSAPQKKLIVFDECYFQNCSTEAKCERIIEKYGTGFSYKIYQDSTGDGRHGHGVGVSDLNIVNNAFKEIPHQVLYHPANPKRINRLNAVNGRLSNGRGQRFIYITKNCKHLIEDLRKCNREEFLNGNFKDKARGHMGDCLGYLVHYRYPILRKTNHQNRMLSI